MHAVASHEIPDESGMVAIGTLQGLTRTARTQDNVSREFVRAVEGIPRGYCARVVKLPDLTDTGIQNEKREPDRRYKFFLEVKCYSLG